MNSGTAESGRLLLLDNYFIVSSLALLVYDYCLMFTSEVDLIWGSKLSLTKVMYFLSRYLAFVDVSLSTYIATSSTIQPHSCIFINEIATWSTIFGFWIAEVILLLRTSALWGQSKKILFGLSLVLGCVIVSGATVTGFFLRTVTFVPGYPPVTSCNFNGSPIIFFDFIIVIVFETVIVVLTLYRWYKRLRFSTSPLAVTLYQDGILFFVCLFTISLINLLVQILGPVETQLIMVTPQRVMHSILSCRILLHLRETDRATQQRTLLSSSPIEMSFQH